MGNCLTKKLFAWCSGHEIQDTQTGLRGFSTESLSFLQEISGERYEYEMNMLYDWVQTYPVQELDIQTIYLNKNESSHFCPLKDGWRIYRNLLKHTLREKLISFCKFSGVSLLSFCIDYGIYSACAAFLPLEDAVRLIVANTIARGISGIFNFEMNRRVVDVYKRQVASCVGVTSLIIAAKGNVWSQILMILFSVLYGIISWQFHYWGEMMTYLGMTMPMAIWSTITWIRNPSESGKEVEIQQLTKKHIFLLVTSGTAITIIFFKILAALETPNIIFSTISITTSFLAASLTMLRSSYYAVGYAANDIVPVSYTHLDVYKRQYIYCSTQ